MFVAVGNAPSSGSTLLADLVDSLPFAVCGPETRLFAVRGYFDDFKRMKRRGFFSSRSPVVYEMRQQFLVSRLASYGFDRTGVGECLRRSGSLHEFCDLFFQRFAGFRGKRCTVFFEKTPENIHCARLFLDYFEEGFFIHVVRNPLYVYKSLLRRGFLPYIAAGTWLIDEAAVCGLSEHPRFFTIRYEELVKKPFETVVGLLRRIGMDFDPERLAELYRTNEYRRRFETRIESWSFKEFGRIGDANMTKVALEDLRALGSMMNAKVGTRYAREFSLPEVSFRDLVRANGYSFKSPDEGPSIPALGSPLSRDGASFRFLVKKSLLDLMYRDCGIRNIRNYLRPIETVSG
ncbi:MAG: sulfotransferase [Deltaproteobacteria bacterium]|nr:sulfotransferase [Deltaproteobacteria bacterium]